MPHSSVEFCRRAADIGFELKFANPRVQVLPGRLQHEEVRNAPDLVIAPRESLSSPQRRKNLQADRRQILRGLMKLDVSSSNFQRDLIPHGDVPPGRLLPLRISNRNATLIAIENRQRHPQSGPGLVAASLALGVRIVDSVKIHELPASQSGPLAGRLDGDLRRAKIRSHHKRIREEGVQSRVPRVQRRKLYFLWTLNTHLWTLAHGHSEEDA